jgi:hypothetical protein
MPSPEVIEAGFEVSFFAGELVMIGVVIAELKFAAPGVIIRFWLERIAGNCPSNDPSTRPRPGK